MATLTVVLQGLSMGSIGGSDDDEMGYVVLSTEEREGLVFYQRDELIATDAIRYSRGLHEECATGPTEASINPAARLTSEGFRARVEYQSRMVEALQAILEPPAPLMPQSSVFLDYIPWVRYMVTVDDILERRSWEGIRRGQGGRCTRNSMGTRYARSVGLREGQRNMLTESGLGGGAVDVFTQKGMEE